MEDHLATQSNIGELYKNGWRVPRNYLCTLTWFLKSATVWIGNSVGLLFEHGYGVPLNKDKALEWYAHGGMNSDRNRFSYHQADKKKSFQQLLKETRAILDSEKRKLEEKQDKTQQEIEILEQLNITYKLTNNGKDAWKDAPILFADGNQYSVKSANNSVTSNKNETLELKKQIQLLKQEKNIFESQAR